MSKRKIKLTEEFLRDKVNKLLKHWEDNNEYSSIGKVYHANQIYETKSGNYNFVIYNLCGFFHGHFLFTVNPDNFDYAIQQESCYGGFIWTRPPKDKKIYTSSDIPDDIRLMVEAYIAYTFMLTIYDEYCSGGVMSLEDQICVSGEQWYPDLLDLVKNK